MSRESRVRRLTAALAICAACGGLIGCRPAAPVGAAPLPAETPPVERPAAPTLASAPPDTVPPPEDETPAAPPPAEERASDAFSGLRIDDLAAREYGGTGIVVGEATRYYPAFTRHRISYPSDGLTITGLVNIPRGEGPFPVIVLNHGYLTFDVYEPGADTWQMADWLAEHGYITLMPDYRNYGGSDRGPNPFHIGYAIDVLNLIAQVDSLPGAAPGQIGVIGHSMGGEISMWPMVLSDEVDAVVLYASMSGDLALNYRYALRSYPVQRGAMEALGLIYGTPDEHPEAFTEMSPASYFDRVRMPVLIHHGMLDDIVPYAWSVDLERSLHEAGADVTFYAYGDQGHAFRGRTFELFMGRNLALLEAAVRADVNTPAADQ
ncbi:MAG: hypothetical protein Kow00124_12800 [Anaerolineae bacterium]